MARPRGVTLAITKDDLEKLYFVDNKTIIEIGATYKCDRKNIDYYFKKFGIPKKSKSEALTVAHANKRGTVIDTVYIKAQVDSGRFVGDIAKELGVSRNTITAHCKNEGMNFNNHTAQCRKQAELMTTNNPVPRGSTRDISVTLKRKQTISENFEYHELFLSRADLDFREYAKKARSLAYAYYKNNTLYEDSKVIDHIFSISDGYVCNVPLVLISHPTNLRLVSASTNCAKGGASIGDLFDFHNRIGLQR